MRDSEGRITTYYQLCTNYSPDKNKPTNIHDTKLGLIYECTKFEYDSEKSATYSEETAKKERFCFLCKHYSVHKIRTRTINDLFIPYDLAVTAKERGFNQPCLAYFYGNELRDTKGDTRYYTDSQEECKEHHNSILAPLYQQIIDWLNKGEIIISIYTRKTNGIISHSGRFIDLRNTDNTSTENTTWEDGASYGDYYEALNKALENAFNHIK